jgi:hypothetical protein
MKLCSSNKRLIKELIRGLNLLSYNKKEIINRTWMGEQPEKLTFDEILDLEYGQTKNEFFVSKCRKFFEFSPI